MIKRSSMSAVFDQAKSVGCKKLRNHAANSYTGLSEKQILHVTNSEFKYRVHNVKCNNKAVPKPVFAKHIQSQHQIDLIDLSKDPVKNKGKLYKYILSVMDVMARCHGKKVKRPGCTTFVTDV